MSFTDETIPHHLGVKSTVRRVTVGREGGDIYRVSTVHGSIYGTERNLTALAHTIQTHFTHPESQ